MVEVISICVVNRVSRAHLFANATEIKKFTQSFGVNYGPFPATLIVPTVLHSLINYELLM